MKIVVEVDDAAIQKLVEKGVTDPKVLAQSVRTQVQKEVNKQIGDLVGKRIKKIDVQKLIEAELAGIDFNARIKHSITNALNHVCDTDW